MRRAERLRNRFVCIVQKKDANKRNGGSAAFVGVACFWAFLPPSIAGAVRPPPPKRARHRHPSSCARVLDRFATTESDHSTPPSVAPINLLLAFLLLRQKRARARKDKRERRAHPQSSRKRERERARCVSAWRRGRGASSRGVLGRWSASATRVRSRRRHLHHHGSDGASLSPKARSGAIPPASRRRRPSSSPQTPRDQPLSLSQKKTTHKNDRACGRCSSPSGGASTSRRWPTRSSPSVRVHYLLRVQ